jgi:4-amino-4-deoxy-L-arabinose transferase-like glycosyltransferase
VVGIRLESSVEAVTFGAVCGMGVVGTGMLAVCFPLGVNGVSIGVFLLGLVWSSRRELGQVPDLVRMAVREVLGLSGSKSLRFATAAVFLLLAATLIGLSVAPPVDWDTLAYHVEVPRDWLAAGRIILPADNFHAAYVGLQHLLYLPLLAVGGTAAPAILNALLALLAGLATFALARDLYGRRTAAVSHWLFWANPLILLVAVTPRVDVTLALFVVLAIHAISKAVRANGERGMLVVAAVITGMGVGVKYMVLAFAVVLAPLWLVGIARFARGNRARFTLLFLIVLAAGVGAAAPWLLKNQLMIGAPLYPFWARIRIEPWLQPLYHSALLPSELVSGTTNALRQIRTPFNLVDLFFRPWRLMADPGNQYSAPTLALWLLPLGVLLPRKRVAAFLAVPALIFAVVVLLASRETNLRYLLPALPPLLIVVAAVMDHATRLSGRGGNVLVAILLAILLAPTAVAVAARVRESPTVAYLTGRASRIDYLKHYWETGSYMPVVEWANGHLPRSSMTLALFEPRKFYFDIPMRGDVAVRNWPLLEPFAHPPGCLRDAGITHVLVNDAAVEFYKARGMRLDAMHWDRFERYRASCLELMLDTGVFRYFRVRQEMGAADSSIGTPGM